MKPSTVSCGCVARPVMPNTSWHSVANGGAFAPAAARGAWPTTAGQGLFLTIPCIPAIHGGQMCRCREAQDVRERPSMAVRCRI